MIDVSKIRFKNFVEISSKFHSRLLVTHFKRIFTRNVLKLISVLLLHNIYLWVNLEFTIFHYEKWSNGSNGSKVEVEKYVRFHELDCTLLFNRWSPLIVNADFCGRVYRCKKKKPDVKCVRSYSNPTTDAFLIQTLLNHSRITLND